MTLASSATGAESIRRGRSTGTGYSSITRPGRARQQDDAVAQADRLADVVGDEQDGEPPANPLADPVELVVEQVAGHRVERAERLVHQQHVRLLGQRAGERDPLAHAAGQLVRPLAAEAAKLNRV